MSDLARQSLDRCIVDRYFWGWRRAMELKRLLRKELAGAKERKKPRNKS